MSSTMIWVLAAVLVVLVLAALVAIYLRRRRVVYRDRAEELRRHALFQSEDIPAKEADARGARSASDEARRRAEELEGEARQKEAALERARSRVEDTVREADRIDPEVRHKSGGYVPSLALDQPDSAPSDEPRATGAEEAEKTPGDASASGGPVSFGASSDEGDPRDQEPTTGDAGTPEAVADPATGGPYEQPAPPSAPKHAAD